jgi:2-polyprenyl-6-methoxyphenol hydroxylase-like FAD-dependent oxidoreductase
MRRARTSEVIVVGGGVVGLCASLLLARDGHRVRLLERDPAAPPPRGADPWRTWERRGVNQFHLLHAFLPWFRELLDAELPDVTMALESDGAARINRLAELPDALTGGRRAGDERFDAVTGRRPMVEATLARLVDEQPGVDVLRGVAVRGLVTAEPRHDSAPHVAGVLTDEGDELRGDMVIDASGRRTRLPSLLAAVGARVPAEEREDTGFVYYCRHFRSTDGSMPPTIGPPLQHYDSISIVTLPADQGTWGVGIVASGADRRARTARDPEVWSRIVKSYPVVAHWLEGEPITDIDVMAAIHDARRTFWLDGAPVATGILPVGDAWACTNPALGRGASIGLRHAIALRDVLGEVPPDDTGELSALARDDGGGRRPAVPRQPRLHAASRPRDRRADRRETLRTTRPRLARRQGTRQPSRQRSRPATGGEYDRGPPGSRRRGALRLRGPGQARLGRPGSSSARVDPQRARPGARQLTRGHRTHRRCENPWACVPRFCQSHDTYRRTEREPS